MNARHLQQSASKTGPVQSTICLRFLSQATLGLEAGLIFPLLQALEAPHEQDNRR